MWIFQGVFLCLSGGFLFLLILAGKEFECKTHLDQHGVCVGIFWDKKHQEFLTYLWWIIYHISIYVNIYIYIYIHRSRYSRLSIFLSTTYTGLYLYLNLYIYSLFLFSSWTESICAAKCTKPAVFCSLQGVVLSMASLVGGLSRGALLEHLSWTGRRVG